MTGGFKLSAGTLSLLAATGILLGGGVSARAADLGGDCCADLEERIAELEATTARKGNRKVSLTVYGQVNEAIGYWDDGVEQNVYNMTNDTSRTRIGFKGKAKINSDWFAEYKIEIGIRAAAQQGMDAEGYAMGSNGGFDLRHSSWTLGSKTYGEVTVGQTSMAHDGILQIQTANIGHFSNNDIFDFPSSFEVRNTGSSWIDLIQNREPGEGSRANAIRYDTPEFAGFKASAHWGEDDLWGMALRYAGEIGSFELAAGIGYAEMSLRDEECTRIGSNDAAAQCEEFGTSGSIMHTPTGIFVTGGYGIRWDEVRELNGGSEENVHWLVQAGIEQKWNALGKTTVFGGYQNRDAGSNETGDPDVEVDMWELGVNQEVSAAAMNFYLHYKHYEPDLTTAGGAQVAAEDFQTVIGGAMIKF
jgi:predicted porin